MKKVKQINPRLSEEQKAVLFEKATEQPFSGTLLLEKRRGGFECANCGEKLFDADDKYESGSGWPSFTTAVKGAVKLTEDTSHGMRRVEVICTNCGSHLGHVFEDGPEESGGMRYCINSAALAFKALEKHMSKKV